MADSHAPYKAALTAIRDRCEGDFDSEYARGQLELAADLFDVPGTYTSERVDSIRRDLK